MNHTDLQPSIYIAPVLSLISLLLILFAYTASTSLLHGKVALLVVSPSLELTNSSSSQGVDGPTIFLGALGSCSRPNDEGSVTCTPPTVSPTYDLTVLPQNLQDLLTAPTATTPVFITIAIGFFLAISETRFNVSTALKRLDRVLSHSDVVREGCGGITQSGSGAPHLIAQTGNVFHEWVSALLVWMGYAFYAVPLIYALARLHVTTGSK
ncbi:hypothetical protein EDB92DRAFT_1935631 [Lactarius akahatsu]|uniref:Uncharacterized protein n=1 Tax=Lactarius akahatsu TaxID=416441 RepID=A0AAD4LCL4_9AGAM|nr:hypothetical protein EDB92DRAFT_1935631 [Lactarius akahatsu]